MKKITILSGAGMSAESGIKTFRDADGLWEGHDVMQVASIQGFRQNPELVLEFYNQRRNQLFEVEPNAAHRLVADLEKKYAVTVATQNVDDLHERAGSSHVIHIHGELRKVRSTGNPRYVVEWEKDCNVGDMCPDGFQLRPHIVWFGEEVPLIQDAAEAVYDADIIIVIGTSMQVYPAAGLVGFTQPHSIVYYIDPKPQVNEELRRNKNLEIIPLTATEGMRFLVENRL